MRKLDLNDIKSIQLEIMDDIHDFCVRNKINYTLAEGSLLGAVRHKGYIPWDDDIDIAMPRPDYERFLKEYQPSSVFYKLKHYGNDKDFVLPIAKVYDVRTILDSPNYIDNQHVFIDIFPLDGAPDNEINMYVESLNDIIFNVKRQGKYYKYAPSIVKKIEFYLKYIIKNISLIGKKKSYNEFEDLIARYPYQESDFILITGSAYGSKAYMPKSLFDNFTLTKFENRDYFIIEKADQYLTKIYGNWRELPPKEKRIPRHTFDAYFK